MGSINWESNISGKTPVEQFNIILERWNYCCEIKIFVCSDIQKIKRAIDRILNPKVAKTLPGEVKEQLKEMKGLVDATAKILGVR